MLASGCLEFKNVVGSLLAATMVIALTVMTISCSPQTGETSDNQVESVTMEKYDDADWHYGNDYPEHLPDVNAATHMGMSSHGHGPLD